jgi:RNA polymerase sigma-70 factor (ECF subfamily)
MVCSAITMLEAATTEQQATDGVLVHEGSLSQRDPEGLLIENSLSEDVSRALAALPADFRLAVVLCDVEGFSYKEIAEIMECPVGTVMSRLHRGRRLLKESLREYAEQAGIVRPRAAADGGAEGRGNTIDLADYRRSRDVS